MEKLESDPDFKRPRFGSGQKIVDLEDQHKRAALLLLALEQLYTEGALGREEYESDAARVRAEQSEISRKQRIFDALNGNLPSEFDEAI